MNTLVFNVPLSLDYDDAVTVASSLEREAREARERARSARAAAHGAGFGPHHDRLAEDCARIALAIRKAIQAEAERIEEAGE